MDLCLADFNEDGRTDVATANGRGNSISVLLGATVGFGASVDLPAVAAPSAVTATDFDGDGNEDLVAANEAAGTLSVWLGRGDGTFGGRIDLPGGGSPKDVAAADLDGDGKPDLVTANSAANSITVHKGDGSGGVATSVDLAAGPDPSEVLIADMNGDGKPDLIVASQGASAVEIHLNRGGTFAPRGAFVTGIDPSALACDDYNQDGDLDLAVCDSTADCVAVLEGDGAGGVRRRTDYPVGRRPENVLCGDLDRDGRVDLVSTNLADDSVSVLPNGRVRRCDWGLVAALENPIQNLAQTFLAGAMAAGDVNRDGKRDLVVAANGIGVLLGLGNGRYAPPRLVDSDSNYREVELGDVDGDGFLDIVTIRLEELVVLRGDGTGSFGGKVTSAAPREFGSRFLALGHLNGDEHLDLVLATRGFGGLTQAFFGDGTGSFGDSLDLIPTDSVRVSHRDVEVADTNGDNHPDIVLGWHGELAGSTRPSGFVTVFLGTGAGTFVTQTRLPLGFPNPSQNSRPDSLALGDLNGDGNLDLAVGIGIGVSVFRGDGAGGFGARTDLNSGFGGPEDVHIADLNHDGHADLFLVDDSTPSLLTWSGKGDLTFEPLVRMPAQASWRVLAEDLNSDGRLDVVSLHHGGVSVHLGQASGGFQTRANLSGAYGGMLVLEDFDQDGVLDLISGAIQGIRFNKGLGSGDFTPGASFTVNPSTSAGVVAAAGDVDGDGLLDVVVLRGGATTGTALLGDGRGGFPRSQDFTTVRSSSPILLVVDLNGDGRDDVVSASGYTYVAAINLSQPAGTFTRQADLAIFDPVMASADFDRDGNPDLAIGDRIFLGAGDGSFGAPTVLGVARPIVSVTAAEVDRDSKVDLVVGGWKTGLEVFRGDGQGAFNKVNTLPLYDTAQAVEVADLNDDGWPDVVAFDRNRLAVFLGAPGGVVTSRIGFETGAGGWSGYSSPSSLTVGDVNSDGKLDVLTGGARPISVLLGR